MPTFSEALEVKRKVEDQLFALPGVHCVDLGGKITGGIPTGEFAICVYVLKKKPNSELQTEDIIPPEIDSIKTDVIESGYSVLHAWQGGAKLEIRFSLTGEEGSDTGTLGCFAWTEEPTPKQVILSNDHVLYGTFPRRQNGDPLEIEGCCCNEVFATLLATGGDKDPIIDAAIAELKPDQKWLPRIHDLAVVGTLDLSPEAVGRNDFPAPIMEAIKQLKLVVKKYGAATGLKLGVVSGIDAKPIRRIKRTNVEVQMEKQLNISPIYSDYFSQEGDSGSVIYIDNSQDNNSNIVNLIFGSPPVKNPDKVKIIALFWGGDEEADEKTKKKFSKGCHIQYVTSSFKIRIATNPPAVVYQVGGEPKPHPALQRFYGDLSASGRAREFVDLYGRHIEEVKTLLQNNRRFIVAWNRGHGSKIMRALIDLVENRTSILPTEFEGQSWIDSVQRVAEALLVEGSPTLKSDVISYLPLVVSLSGRSYEEFLGFLVVSDAASVVVPDTTTLQESTK